MQSKPHPTQQQVRDWMTQRQVDHTPPPTPEEVRRQLGWNLVVPDEQQRNEHGR